MKTQQITVTHTVPAGDKCFEMNASNTGLEYICLYLHAEQDGRCSIFPDSGELESADDESFCIKCQACKDAIKKEEG